MKRVVALALVVGLLSVGCAPNRTLVGKWNASVAGQTAPVEFKADKTMEMTLETQGVKAKIVTTWDVTGDTYTSTLKDIQLLDVPEALKAMAEAEANKYKGQSSKGKIVWNSDKEVVIEPLADAAGAKNPITGQKMTLTKAE